MSKISIVNVLDYGNIQKAVVAAIKMIESDLQFNFNEAKSILLKPNLLIANKNACTQPSFVEGVLSYLESIGVPMDQIIIGDSPGQFNTTATKVAKSVGIFDIAKKYGIEFVDFETEVPVSETIKGAKYIEKYYIAKPVKDCDVIINLPRLKTHAEATITGALKNYWGVIPGGLKAQYHLLGKNEEQFGEVLAENFSWIVGNKPKRLTVYDLHTIMDGQMGPVAGNMRKWNLILVGTDELALDMTALEIGKFKGIYVPHLRSAVKRDLGNPNLNEIDFVGMTLQEAKRITPKFKVPNDIITRVVSYLTGNIGYQIMKKIPILNRTSCKKCGQCAQICPAEAISFVQNNYPNFIRKKCISCLCCLELCPHHAISSKSRGLAGLLDIF